MNVCSLASVNSAPPYGEDDDDDEPDEDEISWAVVVAAADVELALFSEPSDATASRAAFDVSLLPVLSVRLLYGRRSLFAALKHNKIIIVVKNMIICELLREIMKRTCFGHSDIEALL